MEKVWEPLSAEGTTTAELQVEINRVNASMYGHKVIFSAFFLALLHDGSAYYRVENNTFSMHV